MKLLFAIVQSDDVKPLMLALVKDNISVTRISSSGGFLSTGNQTLMIGIDESRLEDALNIIKTKSHSRKSALNSPAAYSGSPIDISPSAVTINVGGATVFVLDAEQYKF